MFYCISGRTTVQTLILSVELVKQSSSLYYRSFGYQLGDTTVPPLVHDGVTVDKISIVYFNFKLPLSSNESSSLVFG